MLEHFNERKENGGYYMSKFMFKKPRDHIIYMMISDEFATPTLIIFWKSNIFQ